MKSGTDTWRLEFARAAAKRRAEENFHLRQRDERKERTREEDKAEDAATELAATFIATTSQIADFNATLDIYDAAVIEALDDNRRQLDEVRAELKAMLAQAYVIDDGRRVFEADDGTVIDEHGATVSPDIVTAEEIPDHLQSAGQYLDRLSFETALDEKRGELLDLQDELDAAREAGAEERVTSDRLEEILDEIELDAPIEVQRHVPGYEQPEPVEARSEFSRAATDPTLAASKPILDTPVFVR